MQKGDDQHRPAKKKRDIFAEGKITSTKGAENRRNFPAVCRNGRRATNRNSPIGFWVLSNFSSAGGLS